MGLRDELEREKLNVARVVSLRRRVRLGSKELSKGVSRNSVTAILPFLRDGRSPLAQ